MTSPAIWWLMWSQPRHPRARESLRCHRCLKDMKMKRDVVARRASERFYWVLWRWRKGCCCGHVRDVRFNLDDHQKRNELLQTDFRSVQRCGYELMASTRQEQVLYKSWVNLSVLRLFCVYVFFSLWVSSNFHTKTCKLDQLAALNCPSKWMWV